MPEPVDAVFISYYCDLDRWDNDETGRPQPSLGRSRAVLTALTDDIWMKDEVDLIVDGRLLDFSRFLSWVEYGTTAEHRRYDPFNMTLLSGTYFLSFLRDRHRIRIVNAADQSVLRRCAERYEPRFVLLSTTLLFDAADTESIPAAVREIRRQWPDAIVVLGGLLLVSYQRNMPPAAFASLLLRYGADAYVVSPRAEASLAELLSRESLKDIADGSPIPNTYVVTDGRVRAPGSQRETEVSMADTYIRWNHLPQTDHLYHTVHTRTARSCAFNCAFCEYPVNQGPLTLAPLEAIRRELDELTALGTVRSLVFTDDTFNVPRKRFKDIVRLLSNYDFEWYSFYRPQFADEETAMMMKDSGCRAVFAGLESADDTVLANMNKRASNAEYRRGISNLSDVGVSVHANFIVGFPGETEKSARKIISFLDDTGVDFCTICTWAYIPSTPIAARAAEFGIEGVGMNWRHDTMDSTTAQYLARSVATEQRTAVHNAVRGEAWTEFLLYANGFEVGEARVAIETYNAFLGRDVSAAQIRASSGYLSLQKILERRRMPDPEAALTIKRPAVA
jgi:radical SAM superfamily enzyme YgiQ (UPF0313 family)